ncbi:helix-turn-helix domain-containing protein [Algoriphagus sp. AGSA1]|uniref:helix-turn-helix domain-containing protein n=1 Tax=Algoriphagus sp. AGSA1 TaxID=2907213 RepID=UPI001F1CCDE5|nr:helix-turn-helix transcriptional regulator [Algoriphagus sp. AGSA1]MCE7053115.1 helix-turn-helix domain-containing protein [Algoriphagus sp. AGSA1]
MEISEKIALTRKKKGLSQEQLAEAAKVTVRTIQRIESGESIPRAFTLRTLAEALEINFEDLVTIGEVHSSGFSDDSVALQTNFDPDDEKHTLQVICLACFSYLVVPFVHFLIPAYFLKKSGSSNPRTITVGRTVIRRQIYWTVALSLVLLLTSGYNFIVAVYFEESYLLHYLWPFFGMYILNFFIILHSLIRVNTRDDEPALAA